ncbi:protein of unknown function [Paraburkholderia dioscoreae]|uniref:Uncharacterized protein n=1 Tax=Paraburkholderia dioscoreae TaxID=2604047 RepID=A0A5Q4YXG4_9BURK|nr:protein of unknown function [Paraburkholderia dioscoreae]
MKPRFISVGKATNRYVTQTIVVIAMTNRKEIELYRSQRKASKSIEFLILMFVKSAEKYCLIVETF